MTALLDPREIRRQFDDRMGLVGDLAFRFDVLIEVMTDAFNAKLREILDGKDTELLERAAVHLMERAQRAASKPDPMVRVRWRKRITNYGTLLAMVGAFARERGGTFGIDESTDVYTLLAPCSKVAECRARVWELLGLDRGDELAEV